MALKSFSKRILLFALASAVAPAPITQQRDVFRQNMEWLRSMKKQCGPAKYFSLNDQTCKPCNNGGEDYEECKILMSQEQLNETNNRQNFIVTTLQEIQQQQREEKAAIQQAHSVSTAAVILSIIAGVAAAFALVVWYCHHRAHRHGKPVQDPINNQHHIQQEVQRQIQIYFAGRQPQ